MTGPGRLDGNGYHRVPARTNVTAHLLEDERPCRPESADFIFCFQVLRGLPITAIFASVSTSISGIGTFVYEMGTPWAQTGKHRTSIRAAQEDVTIEAIADFLRQVVPVGGRHGMLLPVMDIPHVDVF